MSTWSRQVSTFTRSSNVSAVCVMAVCPPFVRAEVDEPCRPELALLTRHLRTLRRRTLRRSDRARAGPGGRVTRDRVGSVVAGLEPLGLALQRALALGGEVGNRPLELPGEPSPRLLLGRPHRLRELARGVLEQPRRLALERALQPLDLPSLDVGELRLDARDGLALLSIDPPEQLPLARRQPVGDLLQRPAPLCGQLLQVRGGRVDRLLGGALGLLPEARHGRLVLARLDRDRLRLLAELPVDVRELGALALLDARDRGRELRLQPLQV